MKVNNQTMKLISSIEYKIGHNCYNGNSYDGWHDTYGKSFRYPICYDVKVDDEILTYKTRFSISQETEITKENLGTVCYKFGSNELLIGRAIVDVLNMLEDRYSLDFNKLEEEYQKNKQ